MLEYFYVGLRVEFRYSCQILMKFEFSDKFSKTFHIKFHENLFCGSRDVSYGQTGGRADRHDKDNSRLSQFYERA
jgi:hypothetical protein